VLSTLRKTYTNDAHHAHTYIHTYTHIHTHGTSYAHTQMTWTYLLTCLSTSQLHTHFSIGMNLCCVCLPGMIMARLCMFSITVCVCVCVCVMCVVCVCDV